MKSALRFVLLALAGITMPVPQAFAQYWWSPTVTLTASPRTVSPGGASTLSWSSTRTTACTASGAWSGAKALSGSQSTGALNSSATYTISCAGAGGSTARASVTVAVASATPPPTVTLSASPTTISPGGSGTLTWTSTNATSCTASGAWSGAKPVSGSQSGTLNASAR